MKTTAKLWAVLGILALALIFSVRGCRDKSAELAALKAKDLQLTELMETKDIESARKISAYEERIGELQGYIDSANTRLETIDGQDEKLAAQTVALAHAEANAASDAELIVNLRKQRDLWKARFDLCQQKIAEKDNIIFSLKGQYEAQVKITLEKDAQIKMRDDLLAVKTGRILALENQIAKDKFWGKVKTYAALGGLAYVVIDVAASLLSQ